MGQNGEDDQIYRLTYDGSVSDEQGFVAMGGQADTVAAYPARSTTDPERSAEQGGRRGCAVRWRPAPRSGRIQSAPGAAG